MGTPGGPQGNAGRVSYCPTMSLSEPISFVLVTGLVLAVLGAGFALLTRHRTSDSESAPQLDPIPPGAAAPQAAVVVNPSKFTDDGRAVRASLERSCRRHGWRPPLWIETTPEDPGAGQTREALSREVDLVIACGGDGTVRQVAEVLAGTEVPMGLIPAGTGNLLARNVGINVTDLDRAIEAALTGQDLAVDVGHISFDGQEPAVFMVMAGMGMDADIMLSAPEDLKARVGPAAYWVSGARHLYGPRTKVRISVDDEPLGRRRVRAIIVGNCGKLVGGLVLMPDARVDDGLLDAVSIAPQGVVGWGNVATAVVTRDRRGHRTFERFRGARISATAAQPLPAEIDGDPVGQAQSFETWVESGALRLRTLKPPPTSSSHALHAISHIRSQR